MIDFFGETCHEWDGGITLLLHSSLAKAAMHYFRRESIHSKNYPIQK